MTIKWRLFPTIDAESSASTVAASEGPGLEYLDFWVYIGHRVTRDSVVEDLDGSVPSKQTLRLPMDPGEWSESKEIVNGLVDEKAM